MNDARRYPATWFDGRTARSRDVGVEIGPGGVRVLDADGGELAAWPTAEVRLAQRRAGDRLRLRRREDDAARLTIADAAALTPLLLYCRNLGRQPGRLRDHWRQVALWGGGAVAGILFLFFVGIPWLAGVAARTVPPAVEIAWGADAVEPMARLMSRFMGGGGEPRFCETPAGRAALDRLVGRLTADRDPAIPPMVRVLDAPGANAFALPGGQILIVSGLLAEARNSGELAGVLAHEIGHVEHRHALEGAFRSVGIAALLSFVVGDVTGGTLLVIGTRTLLETAYSRDAERDADSFAVELLNSAGIDAGAMAAFFERLTAGGGDAAEALDVLSTHPPSAVRAAAIRAAATGSGAAMSAADWQALRAMCDD